MFKITRLKAFLIGASIATLATYYRDKPLFDSVLENIADYYHYGSSKYNIPLSINSVRSAGEANHAIHYPKNAYWIKIDKEGNITMLEKSITGVYPLNIRQTDQDFDGDGEKDFILKDNRGKTFPFTRKSTPRGLRYHLFKKP